MGGLGTYLSADDLQTARGEPVQDTARVLGRYYDAIVCRTYKQTTLDPPDAGRRRTYCKTGASVLHPSALHR